MGAARGQLWWCLPTPKCHHVIDTNCFNNALHLVNTCPADVPGVYKRGATTLAAVKDIQLL
eukprot:CAMPEP_0201942536 /NCGR_PEP_ID=MMETSP0903-20130614/49218_1 /ASSEMBLY_ACC=CAM_ASM_000552 /TAXON_ID=420261 /ORGANISM="Thalassiosira antarctica, Strain CCMP982" /LENGTH=60 /DNA_ID=CAMNT_0048484951 /DNA_START=36 /DNA_END=215 /DNA_ORIENTATION=+